MKPNPSNSLQRLLAIFMVASGALLSTAANAAPAAAADARAHEGTWKPIAAVLGGARLLKADLNAITLKIVGARYQVIVAGEKEPDQGVCTLDTSANPKRMTIVSTNGPNRGKTFLAIYEMKNDYSMRVCYDLAGQEFPKEFKAPKGTLMYLVGYRRQGESPAAGSDADK